jgi:UMF1 family MFS transporter
MSEISMRKRRAGWMMFDWATQPLYTLGLTFVFAPFFAEAASTYYSRTIANPDAANAAAQSLWFWGQMVAGLFIAFTAPFLGAFADSTGRRMPWIWGLSMLFLPLTWALWWSDPEGHNIWMMLFFFNAAFIAAEFLLLFVNALLPSLGTAQEIGKISGLGAAIGYWGGVLSLSIMLLLFVEQDTGKTLMERDPAFGFDATQREGTRVVGPFLAIWFAVFMIPFFLWVREARPKGPGTGGVSAALSSLKSTLQGAYRRKSLFSFLIASMFYRDALSGLYAAGGIFAKLVLGWSTVQIGVFGIVAAITAALATQIGGYYDSRKGPMPVIKLCCYVLIFVCFVIVGMTRESLFGLISFAAGSSIPDAIFYMCGACIGGAGGAIYASSRSLMVRHTDPERPTQAFGLFALSGRATAFLAPALIAIFSTLTGNPQFGYIPIIILFVLGLWLLRRVNPQGDQAVWSNS